MNRVTSHHTMFVLALSVLSLAIGHITFAGAAPPAVAPCSLGTTAEIVHAIAFSAPHGTPLLVSAGTYCITESNRAVVMTRVTSSESWTVPALAVHHDAPLDQPQALVVQEDETDRLVFHLLLLLPDGQGLDAIGTTETVHARGSSIGPSGTFSAKQRYSGVIMQQGRVQLDADFTEPGSASSSIGTGASSMTKHYGRITMEQGRVQLDADARNVVLQNCKVCMNRP